MDIKELLYQCVYTFKDNIRKLRGILWHNTILYKLQNDFESDRKLTSRKLSFRITDKSTGVAGPFSSRDDEGDQSYDDGVVHVKCDDDVEPSGNGDERCIRCQHRVYPTERGEVGVALHKSCFRWSQLTMSINPVYYTILY